MSGAGPRVALDTAVVLRALLLSDAKSKRMRSAWQNGRCQALIDKAGAQALMKSLAFPALQLDAAQQHELLADFLPFAEVLQEGGKEAVNRAVAAPLLALAKAAASTLDVVVSDCPKRRSELARAAVNAKSGACFSVLDAEEFLASL